MTKHWLRRPLVEFFFLALILGGMTFIGACGNGTSGKECTLNSDCTRKYDQSYKCDKAKGKCVKKSVTSAGCKNDADCVGQEVCENGRCIIKKASENPAASEGMNVTDGGSNDNVSVEPGPCSDNPQKPHYDPNSGECVECLLDEHCHSSVDCKTDCTATAKQCIQNECKDAPCECPLGEKCDPVSKLCRADKKCPGGAQPNPDGSCPDPCKGTQCQPNESPDPANNCKCVAHTPWCEACTSDKDCGPRGKCVENQGVKFCAEDCTNSGTCSDTATYSCLNLGSYKACLPSVGYCPCLNVKCNAGKTCCKQDNACHECCSDADCKGGKVCHNVTFTCVEDKCKGKQCPTGSVCDPGSGSCVCQSPCPKGTCCGGNQCTKAACGGGNNGGTTGCNPPCQQGMKCCNFMGKKQCMAQCPGGGGGGQCQIDADCGTGKICCNLMGMSKMCMNASDPMAKVLCGKGGGGGGGSCKSDADCQAGQKCCPSAMPGLLPNSCKPHC